MPYQSHVDQDLIYRGRKPTTDEEAALLLQWEKAEPALKWPEAARRILEARLAPTAKKIAPPPAADRKERLRGVFLNEWERHALIKGVGRLTIDEELAPTRARALLDKLLKAKEQK